MKFVTQITLVCICLFSTSFANETSSQAPITKEQDSSADAPKPQGALMAGPRKMGPLAANTPEKVAEGYFNAFRNLKNKQYLKYMHPEAIRNFHKLAVELARLGTLNHPMRQSIHMYLGTLDFKEISKLDPEAFYHNFVLRFLGSVPGAIESTKDAKYEVLGHVKETPSKAHVVYRIRTKMMQMQVNKMMISSLRRYKQGWKVMLPAEMEDLMTNLKNQIMYYSPRR